MVDQLSSFISKARNWVETDPYIHTADWSRVDVRDAYHLPRWLPWTQPLYLPYENQWKSGGPVTLWARSNYWLPFVLVIAYVIVIFGIKAYMKNRPFIDCRVPQMYWNGALAIFSIIGSLRLFPFLLSFLFFEGKIPAFCTTPVIGYGGAGPSALWTCFFIFSKVPELLDTVFIVLNKKPLLFLHWYHHITVLLYCWHSYATRASVGLSFAAINFTVHAIMYSYYTVQNYSSLQLSKAKRIKDPQAQEKAMRGPNRTKKLLAQIAPVITILQISQMVVGVFVMYTVFPLLSSKTVVCHTSRSNWVWGLIMYMSYFVLFVLFAIEKYVCPKPKKEPAKDGKEE